MKEKCKGNWPGMGLICAGAVVFLVGLSIVLFKELHIPGYFIPVAVGLVLMLAGFIVYGINRMCDRRET